MGAKTKKIDIIVNTNDPERSQITRVTIVGKFLSSLDLKKKSSRKNDICLPLFPRPFSQSIYGQYKFEH